ncbi:class I SAM-dependent methyltransferase [Methylocaldum sp.]|uniref:class I SAM-dependent methyltransferase n=1 Tax=Methylocaldum sp. TaxID=1969727 RepID=UPI002D446F97|nr:methyltransferase domain-containing protein [Methylocaldum sp.]HYE35634.1 methyltransferase domain-containing protein [Methylocaldum sp.]
MKTKEAPSPHLRQVFLEWYHATTLGQILQTIEASYLQSSLKLTYTQKILQVGLLGCESLYIDETFINNFVLVSAEHRDQSRNKRVITAYPKALPIASASIDVLILPHVIDFETNRHQVLQEVERVLKPDGRLFILGFNPWSVHGILQYLPQRSSFWQPNFISCHRLLDWLSLLKFDAEYNAAFSIASSKIIQRPDSFLSKSRAYLSFAFGIKAIKRTYTLIPIEPNWIGAPELVPGHMLETLQ